MPNQNKSNITRLKNLLRQYRDHIITNQYDRLKGFPFHLEVTDVIEQVDKAIRLLIGGL